MDEQQRTHSSAASPETGSAPGRRVVMLLANEFTHDTRVYKEARSLIEWGCEVHVVAMAGADLPVREVQDGIYVHRVEKRVRTLWRVFAGLLLWWCRPALRWLYPPEAAEAAMERSRSRLLLVLAAPFIALRRLIGWIAAGARAGWRLFKRVVRRLLRYVKFFFGSPAVMQFVNRVRRGLKRWVMNPARRARRKARSVFIHRRARVMRWGRIGFRCRCG